MPVKTFFANTYKCLMEKSKKQCVNFSLDVNSIPSNTIL